MSWKEVLKINSNIEKPLDKLIEEKFAAQSDPTIAKAKLNVKAIANRCVKAINTPVNFTITENAILRAIIFRGSLANIQLTVDIDGIKVINNKHLNAENTTYDFGVYDTDTFQMSGDGYTHVNVYFGSSSSLSYTIIRYNNNIIDKSTGSVTAISNDIKIPGGLYIDKSCTITQAGSMSLTNGCCIIYDVIS